jgi:hypothetical protein
MDENTWIALETQPHSPAANLEHGHRDHGLAVVQTSNGNRFLLFSGQDQHRKTPFMADGLVHPVPRIRGHAVGKQKHLNLL